MTANLSLLFPFCGTTAEGSVRLEVLAAGEIIFAMKKNHQNQNSEPGVSQRGQSWFDRLARWLEIRKLQRELRDSQKFSRFCRKIHCFHLAEIQETSSEEIREQLEHLKSHQGN